MKPATRAAAALQKAASAHDQGKLAEAAKWCRAALELQPENPTALRMIWKIALQQQNYSEAMEWLGRSLAVNPEDVVAHYGMGQVQRLAGNLKGALQSFRKAAALQPDHFESHSEVARALVDLGEFEAAAHCFHDLIGYRPYQSDLYVRFANLLERMHWTEDAVNILAAATRRFPHEPGLYLHLGNLLTVAGNWSAAQRCYAACCNLRPQHAVAQHNWGVSLNELGKTAEAMEAFERAIRLDSEYASAYYSLGLSYQSLNAFDSALLAFECAADIEPAQVLYPLEHARTRIKMKRFAEALAELDTLAQRFSASPELQNLRGIALKNLHRRAQALAAYDQALGASPDFIDALKNRANLLFLERNFSLALKDLDKVMALKPGMDWMPGNRFCTGLYIFEWNDFEQRLAALLDDVVQQRRSVEPLALQCLVDEPGIQQEAARIWARTACAPKADWAPGPDARSSGKIRVAYISRDFKSHPVSFLMAEVFELHDREQFEVLAINYGAASGDAMQQRLRAAFDGFLDVEDRSDKEIAELCRNLHVDIAVDLTGFAEGGRSSIFSWRAAPVQILYLGYLGTAGSALYDYVIADAVTIPAEARPFYDEKVMYLPVYQANDRRRPCPDLKLSRAELGLPEAGFVYCCFNDAGKISPAVFSRWAQILRQVPESVLWVMGEDEAAMANLRRHAENEGVETRRIVFAKRTSRETCLAMQRAADLFLDTLPYNAGTTASDALWMGLPVLTQIGKSFPARMSASLLYAAGLPELVAKDAAEYVDSAVRLARQPALLANLKERLQRGRLECALFDAPRFTRNLEKAYSEAHRIFRAGESATDIAVEETA